jgi:hypothetical protein
MVGMSTFGTYMTIGVKHVYISVRTGEADMIIMRPNSDLIRVPFLLKL